MAASMRWLNSIINSIDVNLSELWEIVKDRGAWLLQPMGLQRVGHNLATEQQQLHLILGTQLKDYPTMIVLIT